jgi:hypothetical protein
MLLDQSISHKYIFLNNKLHQNIVFNVKTTKKGHCVGMVEFALRRQISIKRQNGNI